MSWQDIVFGDTTPAPATPPTPTTTAENSVDNRYALKALNAEATNVTNAAEGQRNHTLNTAAFNLYRFTQNGTLTAQQIEHTLTHAARQAGLTDPEIQATLRSAAHGQQRKPGNPNPKHPNQHTTTPNKQPHNGAQPPENETVGRSLSKIVGADIPILTPEWAWHYNGAGRIQRGTLAIFAGRPGAGKSSAARWLAAKATQGDLRGCFDHQPLNVAYIAGEEPWSEVIAPALVAAGADMNRIYTYHAHDPDGRRTRLLSNVDEQLLTQQFLADNITIVIVDPLMSTISSVADVHRNNEVRDYIEPWARIAAAINGITLGIAHLRKNTSGDAVSLITGSSAFGEVARAVFAFVKDPDSEDGDRIMSQAKNSTGMEDLALTYRIDAAPVTASDGTVCEVGRFRITGDSEVTAEQVLATSGGPDAGEGAECRRWLKEFLEEQGRCQPKDAVKAARETGGWNERLVYRQSKKLGVRVESTSSFPRTTWWSMPCP